MSVVGQVLGKYRITEGIGSESLAEVYRGTQVGLEREVRIRVLPPERAADPAFREAFLREGRVAARLAHPHILTVYDSGQEGDLLYCVTEALTPGSLADRLATGEAPTVEEALQMAVELLKALSYVHEREVVHGDLTPAAVRFDARGGAILTGFGAVEGTGGASPELARGERPDGRSDLHQLGVLLHELLTGVSPAEAGAPGPAGELPAASRLRPEVDEELDDFLRDCLATGPDARLATASEALARLQKIARKQSLRRMSRQVAAPSKERVHEAATASTEEDTLHGDPSAGRAALHPAVVLGPFLILATVGALLLAGILGGGELRLLEITREPGTRSARIAWRASAPCHAWVEYSPRPGVRHRTRVSPSPQTEFRVHLDGLEADTRYLLRVAFSRSPDGSEPTYSGFYQLVTRPELRIRDVEVVERTATRVVLRWRTDRESDTRVRVESMDGRVRVLENPGQKRELDHFLAIHGLEPSTAYRYRVVATDPEVPGQEVTSEEQRLTTRAMEPVEQGPLVELARAYVHKLDRMSEVERGRLERAVREFFPDSGDLDPERRRSLLEQRSTPDSFHERRVYLALWIEHLHRRGRFPPTFETGREPDVEVEYLRELFYVDEREAIRRLDALVAWVADADPP